MHCFNPRAPCGARPEFDFAAMADDAFQSTRPMRGATNALVGDFSGAAVSIHAPHAGRDASSFPCVVVTSVSIHAPHAGRDLC